MDSVIVINNKDKLYEFVVKNKNEDKKKYQIILQNIIPLNNEFYSLQNITKLLIKGNVVIKELPESFCNLTNLVDLDIYKVGLKKLPNNINKLKNLTKVDFTNNELIELPNSICELTKITSFIVCINKIKELPDNIGNLSQLEYTYLHMNKLSKLPASMEKMKKLQLISLDNNEFTEFPEVLCKLKNINDLNIDDNKITSLPKSLYNLKLSRLSVKNNELTEIDDELRNLKHNVEELYFDGNQINKLPNVFCQFPNLRILTINNNRGDGFVFPRTILIFNHTRAHFQFQCFNTEMKTQFDKDMWQIGSLINNTNECDCDEDECSESNDESGDDCVEEPEPYDDSDDEIDECAETD